MILTFPSPFATAYLAGCLVVGGCGAAVLMIIVLHFWHGNKQEHTKMDPQVKSVFTSVLMTLAGSAATWGVSAGLVPAADKSSAANIITTVALAAVTALIGWWKARQVSPTAAIKQVNAQDNGVKVVAANEPVRVVDVPLKGAK